MEAIKYRLKELEQLEASLYLTRQATLSSRAREDTDLKLKRQAQDEAHMARLEKLEQEEDKLRRERRVLARSTLSITSSRNDNQADELHLDKSVGPTTRSKTTGKQSDSTTIPSFSLGNKEAGSPIARESQGRDLFTRPSDGKLVYLQCCVAGCGRSNFSSARALRNHICAPTGLHKILGLITSNSHAIEVCGHVAPAQDVLSTTAGGQAGTVPVSDMTNTGNLPSPPTDLDQYHRQNKTCSQSNTDTGIRSGATLSKTLKPFMAQDLGRAHRTRYPRNASQKEPRARAEEAAEVLNGLMSSDSEGSDETEDGPFRNRKIPADRVDQHKAANRVTNPSNILRASATSGKNSAKITGGDSALTLLAVKDQAIKKEPSMGPSLSLAQSEAHPSPSTPFIAPEAEYVPSFKTKASPVIPNLGGESIATCKRASSAPPVTSRGTKRICLTDDVSECLMRSCSEVTMGRGH